MGAREPAEREPTAVHARESAADPAGRGARHLRRVRGAPSPRSPGAQPLPVPPGFTRPRGRSELAPLPAGPGEAPS